MPKEKRFFWRGKRVSQKVYEKRVQQVETARKLKSSDGRFESPNLNSSANNSNTEQNSTGCSDDNFACDGRRIIHMQTLAEELFCNGCKSILSLMDIKEEKRFGLASIFYIKCRQCQIINNIYTDKQHKGPNNTAVFDTNTKAVIGCLNNGTGNTHLNKWLAEMNIPEMHWNTYKRHENEVGKNVEDVAQKNCMDAAIEERRLTIENADKLKDLLPPHLDIHFIFPDANEEDIVNKNISSSMTVRVASSFDMGWFTRGTGRTYDSLSGTAAMIGYFSKKVIGYVTLNRKCAKCDRGHSREDHDCRLNFVGSAKAMEPHAAVLLTKNNPILKACNLQIGIFIADNDSSSICAVREASSHEVAKQSDKNHTSKGVVNELYKISKAHKELNNTTIQYLKKCFNYCISQNEGSITDMEKAIVNIPYHAFNIHLNCGSWCTYQLDPDNYTHTNIGEGLKNQALFEALKIIFNNLANKCSQFVGGASSNPNESLNSMIVSKAPKSRLYGKTASGDARVACAINKKNKGEAYISQLNKSLLLSPGKHTMRYNSNVDNISKIRYANSITRRIKLKRILLKKAKTALKNQTEAKEGTTYESDIGLLNNLHENIPIVTLKNADSEPITVLFDLETSGFSKTADILQIAMKNDEHEFSIYVKPTQKISEEASRVHGLTYVNGELLFHNNMVKSVSLSEALVQLYAFLCSFEKKCILAAHNCSFDFPRLMNAIKKCFMTEHFRVMIHGYCDTLPAIKIKTGKKGKGDNKLENLAAELNISCEKAHDALQDVIMLHQVLKNLKVSSDDLKKTFFSWEDAQKKIIYLENLPNNMKKLNSLKDCTSQGMRKKMVSANVTYDMLLDAYVVNKLDGLRNVLGKDENGIIKVTKDKKILQKISDYFASVVK